ncbi:MAG: DUF3419 family protein [Bacilli bacterium]
MEHTIISELENLKYVMSNSCADVDFSLYSPVYLFTTENIKGYLDLIDIKDKSVLTPTASGDHAFEAVLRGAKSVDMFDINLYARHLVCLKIAALKSLSRDEFLDFFLIRNKDNQNKKVFSKGIYENKLRKNLDSYSRNFWDMAYSLTKRGTILRSTGLFYNNINDKKTQTRINSYLENDNYKYLKDNIDKLLDINFYNSNILNLPKRLENKYDLILLSNIQAYVNFNSNDKLENIKKYREFVKNDMGKFLNENGKIVKEYYYCDSQQSLDNSCNFKIKSISSLVTNNDNYAPDVVSIYTKRR